MNRLLVILMLLIGGVAALGYYRGWFSFSAASADQKVNFGVTVDQEKIQQDKETAKDKVQDLRKKVEDKTSKPSERGNQGGSGP